MSNKVKFHQDFNLEPLLSLCEQLRGRPCTCDLFQRRKFGSQSKVIFIAFDDGVEWVFRTPRGDLESFYSEETTCKIILSEASTLMFLKTHTSIPVPEVFSYRVKLPAFLLASYNWCQIPPHKLAPKSKWRSPLLPISEKNREKVMSQLGAIMAELSDHRFGEIGSLFNDENGSCLVGECLSPGLTWQERDSLDLDRGPFRDERDYLMTLISALTSHMKELPHPNHHLCAPLPNVRDYEIKDNYIAAYARWIDFMAVIDDSKNILSYCIAGQFLCEMIPHISSLRNYFALSHPDLHLGNFYVDDDFNITCVIDWSSASSGPVTELLATPPLAGSTTPPSDNLVAAFRSGFNQRAPKIALECSRSDLWERSERMGHFSRLVYLLSANDCQHFTRLYELVYKTSTEEARGPAEILLLFHERASTDENKRLLLELQQDLMTEEEEQEDIRMSFRPSRINGRPDALAVARKLELMSEMNPGFFADRKLWRWVVEARKKDARLYTAPNGRVTK
ncbi:hypothetical protein G7046_g7046 [Stylonectria norvegica]|nr:hypothetical protein G7046_g7046 [Stylonectria norvegica]